MREWRKRKEREGCESHAGLPFVLSFSCVVLRAGWNIAWSSREVKWKCDSRRLKLHCGLNSVGRVCGVAFFSKSRLMANFL